VNHNFHYTIAQICGQGANFYTLQNTCSIRANISPNEFPQNPMAKYTLNFTKHINKDEKTIHGAQLVCKVQTEI